VHPPTGSSLSGAQHVGVTRGDRASPTANLIMVDLDSLCRRSCGYEALFTRSAYEDRKSSPRRHVQIRRCSPVRCKPLLGQALREDRQPGIVSRAEKGRWEGPPKTDQTTEMLLEEDLRERPAATVAERRLFLEHATGKSLSISTVGRLLNRLGFSRKNELLWGHWNETSSEGPPGG
jgi:hypothetical protein